MTAVPGPEGRWPPVVCPEDGAPLAESGDRLSCRQGHAWSIQSGIPRMVTGALRDVGAFGLQWKVYRRTQLDSHTRMPISLERARRCIGQDGWAAMHRPGRFDVLEVGCGAGRFTEVLLATGACVTSVDLSAAVDANRENFPQDARHRILQADILRLPFEPGRYDLVFCLGMIQHTRDPEEAIASAYTQVKPGGWLVIDHYTWSLSHFTKTAPLVRAVLRRLPPEQGLRWTERIVKVFFPLHRAARHHHAAQALLSRISPVLSYYHALPLEDDFQYQWALLDTHDSLTDWYKHFRSRSAIRRTLARLGATGIWAEYGGNGVEARCRKPGS